MVRQLPAGFALVIRGGCAPVMARLPRAWKNPAYRRARRLSRSSAEPMAETAAHLEPQQRTPSTPTVCRPDGFPVAAPPTPGADHVLRPNHDRAGAARRMPGAHSAAVAAQLKTETTGCGNTQPRGRLISEADAQNR